MVDEILVHISAPATRQNDNLYHSLAAAYLDFEPHRQYGDEPQEETGEKKPSSNNRSSVTTIAPPEEHKECVTAENSILSTSKDSYGSFPSHISSGLQASASHDASTEPESEAISDAAPTSSRLARLDQLHMKWRKQTTPRSSFLSGHRDKRRVPSISDYADMAFIEDTQLAAQALQSQLQDRYSTTSEETSADESDEDPPHAELSSLGNVQTRSSDADVVSMQQTPTVASHDTGVAQQRVTRLRPVLNSPPLTTQPLSKKPRIIETDNDRTEVLDFSRLPFDAFPPPTRVSVECPGSLPTQVTKHLAVIKAQNPTRFKPSKRRRGSKPDDRGYWSIECSDWPAKIQYEFWCALCAHVTNGDIGWGITLHRESSLARTLGQVRLYCWAEVLEHIWLLLWLCSKGKIVGSRSRWIDAEGKVIFEVA